ncbi:MAG: nucleotide disphospho-sugar-binding domain-containing protein [Kineosporiaceae bacterium]
MTRVLLATCAEWSHAAGLVPLGWGLRSTGWEVVVATQPALVHRLAAGGLPVLAVGRDHRLGQVARRFDVLRRGEPDVDPGGDVDALTADQMLALHRRLVPWWWRMVNEPMLADLVAFCRQWRPDLVVWEATTFAGAVAARACGAAHARFVWSVDVFARLRERFLALRRNSDPDPVADWLAGAAARFGVPFCEDLVSGQATVTQLPTPLRGADPPGVDYLPMRFVPYNGRAVVPDWLREPPRRRRVCLTLGVSRMERFGAYPVPFPDLLDAVADLDADVIATVPDPSAAGVRTCPDNVRLTPFVPLDQLLSTCAALVSHGGPGTVCTGVVHGVPQLVFPDHFDGPALAGLLARTGAGRVAPATDPSPDLVRDEVVRLLDDPDHRDAAARLRETARAAPGPLEIGADLHRLVRTDSLRRTR